MLENHERPEIIESYADASNDAIHRHFMPGVRQQSDAGGEAERMGAAGERLRQLDGLKEENWRELDSHGRIAVMNDVGREVGRIYDQPTPPLYAEQLPVEQRGDYVDEDYRIRMNSEGISPGDGFLSDDPRVALETYLHEFRHSYQYEQMLRWDGPFRHLVDEGAEADNWSSNFKNYNSPENGFNEYYNQSVEADARAFSEELVKKVYG